MSIQRIIGIDFGTSTSVIRIKRYEDGNPVGERLDTKEVAFNSMAQSLVPTLIKKTQDGKQYYGFEAENEKKKSSLFRNFKIRLESQDAEIRKEAQVLTEEFLAYMAKKYKDQRSGGFFGEISDIEKTFISYPVKWSEETRSFMLEAAKKAGFPNVEGMDEAQAAITAVMVQSADYLSQKGYIHDGKPIHILMADMGAGTTDLVLCRYTHGASPKYEILSAWPKDGSTLFGGHEVEMLLQEYLRSKMPEEDADIVMKKCKLGEFKSWKENVVSPALIQGDAVTECTHLELITELLEIDVEEYSLDRKEFEKLAEDYLKGFPELVNGCLKDAGISGSEVDLVLLTGGHSQWYFVAEQLTGKLDRFGEIDLSRIKADPGRIIPVPRPQETVALGLVYSPLAKGVRFASSLESRAIQQVEKSSESKTRSWTDLEAEKCILPFAPENEFQFRAVKGEYKVFVENDLSKSYTVKDGYEIVKYTGHQQKFCIPVLYNGKPIVAIGKDAFNKSKGNAIELKKVEIPGSCKIICENAFEGMNGRSLEEIIMHQGIQVIGKFAFYGNNKLFWTVKFPEGLIEIGNMAFSFCDLRRITIPRSCQCIKQSFSCNYSLSEVVFPFDSKIYEIDEMAFEGTAVQRIKLPRNCGCSKLIRKKGKKLFDPVKGMLGRIPFQKPTSDELITIERY